MHNTRIVETSAGGQTEALGAELAATLEPGDVVLVRGELGTGKTTLIRGAAVALGVAAADVSSPTFAIAHRYRGEKARIAHLDLYRLADLHSEEPHLLDDYLDEHAIAFVEWPLANAPELSAPRLVVTLEHRGGDHRRIVLASADTEEPDVVLPSADTEEPDARTDSASEEQ